MRTRLPALAAVTAASLLAACSGTPDPEPPPAPVEQEAEDVADEPDDDVADESDGDAAAEPEPDAQVVDDVVGTVTVDGDVLDVASVYRCDTYEIMEGVFPDPTIAGEFAPDQAFEFLAVTIFTSEVDPLMSVAGEVRYGSTMDPEVNTLDVVEGRIVGDITLRGEGAARGNVVAEVDLPVPEDFDDDTCRPLFVQASIEEL